jgi:HlyD family secretion protein
MSFGRHTIRSTSENTGIDDFLNEPPEYPFMDSTGHHLLRYLATGALCVVQSALVLAQDAKPVVLARVIEVEVKSGQRVIGTVNPLRTSTIGSAVDGRVKSFLVDQGDPVQQGQILAELQTETLEIEESAAAAEVDLSIQRLAELENGSRPEDIAEADANMRSAKAALTNAEGKLRRMETLSTRSAASPLELDDAKENSEAARFAFLATEALLKRIREGARVETIAQAAAQVELQRQRLELIKDRIKKSVISAPFDGFVSAEFTEVGAWISQGDPIVEVIQLDEVEVVVPVTAEIVVSLRKGDVIRVEFPELPNELLTGTIDRIVPLSATRARTFPVHIKLQNRIQDGTPMLMAGMLARVDLPAGQRQTLPLVPKDALVLNGNDRSVYVVDLNDDNVPAGPGGSGTVRKVNVDLGIAVEERIQVRGNIKVNDLVVVVGNERLAPNSQVQIVGVVESTGP